MNMKFDELLVAFKRQEGEYAECIMPVIDDAVIRNGILAWQSMLVEYDSSNECPEQDSKRQWEWLWSNIKYDAKLFANIARIKEYDAISLINRLKAYRLIYPDGTANNIARAYLRQIVSSKLPKKEKKKDDEKPVAEKSADKPSENNA